MALEFLAITSYGHNCDKVPSNESMDISSSDYDSTRHCEGCG